VRSSARRACALAYGALMRRCADRVYAPCSRLVPAARARRSCPPLVPAARARRSCPRLVPAARARGSCPPLVPAARARRSCSRLVPAARARRSCPPLVPAARARGSCPPPCPSPVLVSRDSPRAGPGRSTRGWRRSHPHFCCVKQRFPSEMRFHARQRSISQRFRAMAAPTVDLEQQAGARARRPTRAPTRGALRCTYRSSLGSSPGRSPRPSAPGSTRGRPGLAGRDATLHFCCKTQRFPAETCFDARKRNISQRSR